MPATESEPDRARPPGLDSMPRRLPLRRVRSPGMLRLRGCGDPKAWLASSHRFARGLLAPAAVSNVCPMPVMSKRSLLVGHRRSRPSSRRCLTRVLARVRRDETLLVGYADTSSRRLDIVVSAGYSSRSYDPTRPSGPRFPGFTEARRRRLPVNSSRDTRSVG